MLSLSRQKNQRIGIFGLKKTGTAAYQALVDVAELIVCYDDSVESRDAFDYKSALRDLSDPVWQTLDKIICSPGIKPDNHVFAFARSHNIPVLSDVDLLFEERPDAVFIGVTGTNGKSTTTALLHHILQEAKLDYPMCGNIGIPVLSVPLDKEGYIMELSSFQLSLSKKLHTKVAVILNITPDHLDFHGSLEDYIHAKSLIFKSTEYQVGSADDQVVSSLFGKSKPVIQFSTERILQDGICLLEDMVLRDGLYSAQNIIPFNISLLGQHNRENILAAYSVAKILQVSDYDILKGIKSFKGLKHRLEYLGAAKNISFYNDSKATNAASTAHALKALSNIYWILGGIAKDGGISSISHLLHRVKKAYLIGQDKELFAKTLDSNQVEYELCSGLDEAFLCAWKDANATDLEANILLSPAAASNDMFKNFEHRGECFRNLCAQQIGNNE